MQAHKMKQIIKSALTATAIAITAALGASAQTPNRSGYFTDNYTYRYQLNPAFANEKGFFSLPAFGNFNLATQGNVGIDNFLFVRGGKTVTGLHPDVSSKAFLGDLKNRNRLGLNGQMGIISFGFNAFHGYNTVSFGMKYNMEFSMPKSIFSLLKNGLQNRDYDISNFDAHADAYAEIALNHSHQINSKLRIGASVKFLIGALNLDVNMNDAHLTLRQDRWTAMTNAKIQANIVGLKYKTSTYHPNSGPDREYVSGAELDGIGVGGYGLAFDLGATYQLNSDWRFSLAFNDLGFISWKNNVVASTRGNRTFNLNDYALDPDNMDGSFDAIGDNIAELYQLDDLGDRGSRTRAIAATMNVGAEYIFPLYRPLTFGLLNTTRIAGDWTWTDFRLSANVQPHKCFSAGINYGYGTFGSSFGCILNFSVTGFNLYLGMDHTLGKLAKQGIPLNPNAQFSFGINFPFAR